MPNWCSNTLWVDGNPEQLKEFKTKTTRPADHDQPNRYEFTLEGLYPTPPELLGETSPQMFRGEAEDDNSKKEYEARVKMLEEKYGYADWYTWRINKWGTKWDVCESDTYENSDTEFMVVFDSAWAPPVNWLEQVAPQFPELKFKLAYSEPGINFCGYASWDAENGFDQEETQLEWQDDRGEPVEYDSEAERWKYSESGEIIDDEDFYPCEYNPYMN